MANTKSVLELLACAGIEDTANPRMLCCVSWGVNQDKTSFNKIIIITLIVFFFIFIIIR